MVLAMSTSVLCYDTFLTHLLGGTKLFDFVAVYNHYNGSILRTGMNSAIYRPNCLFTGSTAVEHGQLMTIS